MPPPRTQMINCHVHTFTTDYVPRDFPFWYANTLAHIPGFVGIAAWVAGKIWGSEARDRVLRLREFRDTGNQESQEEVFEELRNYYPGSTRFVVLPLDMEPIGFGPVRYNIVKQHDRLAHLARHETYGRQIIPFANLHPDTPGAIPEFRRAIETLGFKGLKLYPRLGFAPTDPRLMEEVYPYCVAHKLPVLSHCSHGGVIKKGEPPLRLDRFTAPQAFDEVLRTFPELQVNLAHFGGGTAWKDHLRHGRDPDDPEARERNWATAIAARLEEKRFPGLWTDISYTLFNFEEYIPLLKLYLADPNIRRRVLFGSDFYMTRQEELSEKSVSIRLRNALGPRDFHRIAHLNPRVWLGEMTEAEADEAEAAADRAGWT